MPNHNTDPTGLVEDGERSKASPRQPNIAPFQTQLESLPRDPLQPTMMPANRYGSQSFNLVDMAGNLPQPGVLQAAPPSQPLYANYHQSHGFPHAPVYPVGMQLGPHQQQQQYLVPQQHQHPGPYYPDPVTMTTYQQPGQPQHPPLNPSPPYVGMHAQERPGGGGQPGYLRAAAHPLQFSPAQSYSYGLAHSPFPGPDPRLSSALTYNTTGGPYTRRGSTDPSTVPNFPRGPPRKPKQSGHALWVGNLPPTAAVDDLKEHFSRDATRDIESVFLIAKSNCAFVNYRTEAACAAAMSRFHDSRFHGVRLVCRLRRGSPTSPSIANTPSRDEPVSSTVTFSATSPAGVDLSSAAAAETTPNAENKTESPSTPVIARSNPPDTLPQEIKPLDETSTHAPGAATSSENAKIRDRYFIVKSLTAQDLEASVRNGIWATQSHNEEALNNAYNTAENVYLVFSANKSGEYFGFARMASPIASVPTKISTTSVGDPSVDDTRQNSFGAPQYYPTPASTTAPKGRIIDDSARGTIFWEAEHSDDDDEETSRRGSIAGVTGEQTASSANDTSGDLDATVGGGAKGHRTAFTASATGVPSHQSWGRQFRIEWISTNRLPFYRTRGLRNPWNANREVKIARDGTELEPGIGGRLVLMFTSRPSLSPGAVGSRGAFQGAAPRPA